LTQPLGRFERLRVAAIDDGWSQDRGDGIPIDPADPDDPADRHTGSIATSILPERAKSIITRNGSPDIVFDQSVNPYRGCEHGCVYCLGGDTPILLADGAQKPLAELSAGDRVIGTRKHGHCRRYVSTEVLAHWRTRKPAFRVCLADGTELLASGDHRFLTERGWKFVTMGEGPGQRPHLTVNNTLMGFGALNLPPPPRDHSSYRRGYLCGVVRGDGHLGVYRYQRAGRSNGDQHRFRLAMTDHEALDRSADYLRRIGITTDRFTFSKATATHQAMEAIRTSAQASVAAIGRVIEWPDRPDSDWMRGYVSGIFDAEGSSSCGCLRIANTDPRIVHELAVALRNFGFQFVVEVVAREPRRSMNY
jgi:hypothetical protein